MYIDTISKLDDYINTLSKYGPYYEGLRNTTMSPYIQNIFDLYNEAFTSAQRGDIVKAIRQYKSMLKSEPNFAAARYNLGYCYKVGRNLEEAIKHFKLALRVNPQDAWIYIELGDTYSELGKKDKELNAYKDALKVSPDNIRATKNVGIANFEIGNTEKALAWLHKALSLAEEKSKHATIGMTASGKVEKEKIRIFLDLGHVYQVMGDYQKSEEYCLKGVEVGKYCMSNDNDLRYHETRIWAKLGELYMQMKKWAEAETYLNKCVQRYPSDPMFQSMLEAAKRYE